MGIFQNEGYEIKERIGNNMGINQNKGYEIKERIGKGGCGSVYLAQKEKNTYAIKKLMI